MISIPLGLLVAHFVGDGILQSNWMATGKSKASLPLTVHCIVYALCFLWLGWQFALLTFWLHWLTDWVTSRMSSKLWFISLHPIPVVDTMEGRRMWTHYALLEVGKRHWFFVWLLFDQLLHSVALAFTYKWLVA